MSFLNSLLRQMERSTAGSEETARAVLKMCGEILPKNALFFGDDVFTPKLIAEETGARVLATFYEDFRAQRAEALGMNSRVVGAYEVTTAEDGWEFIWFNGSSEPDGVPRRLEQLKNALKSGGTAVYRTLCWLIDPSPDTKGYVERRFGRPVPLDNVLAAAKEQGFRVRDFYIAPKSDWVNGLYRPMEEQIKRLEGEKQRESELLVQRAFGDTEAEAGIGEVNKETYMFELHSEEYSFVYYILG